MTQNHQNLGGETSNILCVHLDPWGFMMQFDEHIFQMGGSKPPTSKSLREMALS